MMSAINRNLAGLEATREKPFARSTTAATRLRKVTSEELLQGTGELLILHGGREYRLRITQNGKLILTA